MSTLALTPLDRARARRDRVERELKQSPDFQLYLIATSPDDRRRMERLLIQIPTFRLWCMLTDSLQRAHARGRFTSGGPERSVLFDALPKEWRV